MSDKTVTKDTGARTVFPTGGQREIVAGKGRFDLIPAVSLMRLAQLFERGAAKYSPRNWEKGMPLSRYVDSAMRHLNQLLGGDRSEDHAIAVAWNMFAYVWTEAAIKLGRLPADLNDMPPEEDTLR